MVCHMHMVICIECCCIPHQGGRLLIHLGDSDIDYDKNFRSVLWDVQCNIVIALIHEMVSV